MIVLKIIGILLAVVLLSAFMVLMLNLQVIFGFNTEGLLDVRAKISFITVFDLKKQQEKKNSADIKKSDKRKKEKKNGKISAYFQKKFGLDKLLEAYKPNGESGAGISDIVNKIVTLLSLVMGEITWLLRKITVKRFHILAVCGGSDAADAAMEYGAVCAAVYPLVGYIEANLNTAKDSTDIRIGCDFENDAYFETDIRVKLRLIHIVRAAFRNAMFLAQQQQSTEA